MRCVEGELLPDRIVGKVLRHLADVQNLGHHQKHDETAKRVERRQAIEKWQCLFRRQAVRNQRCLFHDSTLHYASSSFTTFPCTSVRRKSRPWKRYVSFVWSNPSRC